MGEHKIGTVFLRHMNGRAYKWFFKLDGKFVPLGPPQWDMTQAEQARQRYLEQNGFLSSETLDNKLTSVFVEKYLYAAKDTVCAKSWRNKVTALRRFSEKFGDCVVADLCPFQVQDWAKSVKSWGDGGRRRILVSIKCAFSYFHERKRLKANPLAHLKCGQSPYRRQDVIISDTTHNKIMNAAPDWVRDILAVLYATGARPAEIIEMTADEYFAASGKIVKRQHKTAYKGKNRIIVVPEEVRPIIERLCAKHPEGRIFRGPQGGTVHGSYLCQRLKEIAREVGVPEKEVKPLCLYSYRHAYAVAMLKVTGSAAKVAGHLGHTNIRLVEVCYGHLVAEALEETEARRKLRELREKTQEKP